MNRAKLILKLRDKLPQHDARLVEKGVKNILYSITNTLANDGRVEIRGFGAFTIKQQLQRNSKNPKTGAAVIVPAKRKLQFKPGKELRKIVNLLLFCFRLISRNCQDFPAAREYL